MNKRLLILIVVLGVVVGAIYYTARQRRRENEVGTDNNSLTSEQTAPPEATSPKETKAVETTAQTEVAKLPESVLIDVPFTSQAPYANWDPLHEDACEEASAIMAAWFAQKKTGTSEDGYKNRISPKVAEAQIQELVTWQNTNFGFFESTTAKETSRVLKEALGVKNVEVLTATKTIELKEKLAARKVILVPAAGQLLGNPYFTAPGPPYHMLLIKGYNQAGFVTNDPGTKRGEGYTYSESVLFSAIHDWTGSYDTITTGSKTVLVVGLN